MKMTNSGMLKALDTLNHFGEMTGEIGFAIMKTRRRLNEELEDYEKQRIALVEKYGERIKNPETGNEEIHVRPDSGNYQKFIDELAGILNMECDVNIYTLPKECFDNMPCVPSARAIDYDVLEALLKKKEDDSNG